LRRGLRQGKWAVGAILLAYLGLPASSVAAPPEEEPVRVVSELRLSAPSSWNEFLELTFPLEDDLKARLAALRRTPSDSWEAYTTKLKGALRAAASFPEADLAGFVADLREVPSLRIHRETATLRLAPGFPVLWRVRDLDSIHFARRVVPSDTRLLAVLHAPAYGVDAADPIPVADDGRGNLRWAFGPGRTAPVNVTLRDSLSDFSGSPFRSGLYFLTFLLPLVVFLAIRSRAPDSRREDCGHPDLIAAGTGLAAICAATYFGISEWQVNEVGAELTIITNGAWIEFLKAAIPALGIAGFVAFAPQSGQMRIARGIAAMLLGLTLASCVAELHQANFGELGTGEGSWLLELLGVVSATLLLGLVIDTVAIWLNQIWASTGRADEIRSALLGSTGRLAIVAAVVGLVIVQVLFGLDVLGDDAGAAATPSLELGSVLPIVPIAFCNLSMNLALPIFGLELMRWLWLQGRGGDLSFRAFWECLAVGLVIATSVIGLTGRVAGYPAPLPFLVSLLACAGALYLLGRGARATLAREATNRDATDRLLDRWLALKKLGKTPEGAPAHSGAEPSEQDRARRRELLKAPGLTGIAEEDREREMLSLGLNAARTARARLSLLTQRGWLIVVVPVGYSALLLIQQEWPDASSSGASFGLAFLLAAVFSQSAMWILAVTAFLLVYPILPGRVGALKGLIAGLFVGLPWLIVQPLHEEEISLHTTYFIPAVLVLLFMGIGLLLDYRTVRRRHEDIRQLGEFYRLNTVRGALVSVPVLLLLLGIVQGLANGQGADALSNAASNLPGVIR
jgi:hypothetical protein